MGGGNCYKGSSLSATWLDDMEGEEATPQKSKIMFCFLSDSSFPL